MASGDSLDDVQPFLGDLLEAMRPGQRRRMIDKLMRMARRHQADRIRRNVEPDEAEMTPRKPRKGRRGKMFKRIGAARNLRIRTHPDRGELTFGGGLVSRTASEHHHGLEGFVGKTRRGRIVRTRYEQRRLIGHGKERRDYVEALVEHLDD